MEPALQGESQASRINIQGMCYGHLLRDMSKFEQAGISEQWI
jgi:hypothetical protein